MTEKGGDSMDELFTMEEMMSKLKLKRGTMYNYMKRGIIPFVELPGGRRFIGSQVMKALKTMQLQQMQESDRQNGRSVRGYTLSASQVIPDKDSQAAPSAVSTRKKPHPASQKSTASKRSKKRSHNKLKSKIV